MQPDRKSLYALRVTSPCPKTWEELDGDDLRRYCGKCQKHVHNLSAMSAGEASDLMTLSGDGHLCVRYDPRPDGRPQFADDNRLRLAFGRGIALICGFTIVACSPAAGWPGWNAKLKALMNKSVLVQKGKTMPPILGRPSRPPKPAIAPPVLGGIPAALKPVQTVEAPAKNGKGRGKI